MTNSNRNGQSCVKNDMKASGPEITSLGRPLVHSGDGQFDFAVAFRRHSSRDHHPPVPSYSPSVENCDYTVAAGRDRERRAPASLLRTRSPDAVKEAVADRAY
ncbi:hypothetical protein GWI33_022528 [Rhynchophorus ferrugineus]|uniref:Uncharacterized protein n=1 Tax=Rhynchophorus ferrugineus TaxID=354439 RepID=A0A834HU10_RHYFE|nr:hypothetical protein GWI33_022528 [Rhynchophorus ferrugineus]